MGAITKQFLYSYNPLLTYVEGAFTCGNAGTVQANSVVGQGFVPSSTLAVSAVVGSGVYQINLAERYQRLVGFSAYGIPAPSSAAVVDGGGIIVGKVYRITVASTGTNWGTLGLPVGITPSTGIDFVATSGASQMPATSTATVGNGSVVQVGTCNFNHIEVLNGYNMEMNATSATVSVSNTFGPGISGSLQPIGSRVNIQCVSGTSAAPTAPTSGIVIRFGMMLRRSSLLAAGETTSNY